MLPARLRQLGGTSEVNECLTYSAARMQGAHCAFAPRLGRTRGAHCCPGGRGRPPPHVARAPSPNGGVRRRAAAVRGIYRGLEQVGVAPTPHIARAPVPHGPGLFLVSRSFNSVDSVGVALIVRLSALFTSWCIPHVSFLAVRSHQDSEGRPYRMTQLRVSLPRVPNRRASVALPVWSLANRCEWDAGLQTSL